MKTVFHKSGGRQMYQSAARSFRKESTATCRFLQAFIWTQACRALIEKNYGRRLREPLCVVCRGTAPHGIFYRPR